MSLGKFQGKGWIGEKERERAGERERDTRGGLAEEWSGASRNRFGASLQAQEGK